MRMWLKKWRNRIRFRKIRSRYLATMIMLSVPPLFLLGLISFNVSKETIMESNTQTNQDTLRTSSEVADLMFRSAINLNRSIILNDRIRDNLRELKDEPIINKAEVKAELIDELQKMINNGFINSRFVDSVCLLDLNYEAYCLGRSDNTGIYIGENKSEAIERSDWYDRTVDGNGRVIFFNNDVLGESDKTFSTVKLFRDSGSVNGEPLGLLIINISKSIFDSFFSGSKKYGGEFIALDISTTEGFEVVQPPQSKELQAVLQTNSDDVVNAFNKLGYLTVTYRNETTGWSFIHLVQTKELLKESNRIGTATALIAFVIAFVAIAISYVISGSITRPLLQVKKMMVEWARGQREFKETFEHDEVGAIGETFKRMTAENKELNEKLIHTELREREAELRALQAQIKPHFLYNTLDSIYWMATLQKHEEAAQMTLALSQSFKLSLNKGRDTLPVSKELEHIHHYMTIQNIRYNHRFEYIEEVEPSVKAMEILKLLLQPLVENAIYHGLERKVGNGTVKLQGKKEGEYLLFVIEDNGIGIDDKAKIDEGYGLQNVKERMIMYYGAASSMDIKSKANEGTRVELRLKLRGNSHGT